MSNKTRNKVDFNSLQKHENIKPFHYFSPMELDPYKAGIYLYKIQFKECQLEEMVKKGKTRMVREYVCQVLEDLRELPTYSWSIDNSEWLIDIDEYTENQLIYLRNNDFDIFSTPVYLVYTCSKKGQKGYKAAFDIFVNNPLEEIVEEKPIIKKAPIKEPLKPKPAPIKSHCEIDKGEWTYQDNKKSPINL